MADLYRKMAEIGGIWAKNGIFA
jgi:hypothetical protein